MEVVVLGLLRVPGGKPREVMFASSPLQARRSTHVREDAFMSYAE